MKNNKKHNNYDVLRWLLLTPAVLLTGYVVTLLLAAILGFISNKPEISIFSIFIWFFVQSIPTYFVGRYIAPKHKDIAGWISSVLYLLFCAALFFGALFGF